MRYHELDYDALDGVDALLICTEWQQYRRPDFQRMRSLLASPVIFDGRNVYDAARMAEHGFEYYSIGRPPVAAAGRRRFRRGR